MKKDNFLNFFLSSLKDLNTVYNISSLDISLKYRRTVLGNIWIIITYFITISIISLVWSIVLNTEFVVYFSRLFIGFTTFYLLLSFTSQAGEILYGTYSGIILSLGVELNKIILRHLMFVILEFLQFIPFYFVIIFLSGIEITFLTFLFIPGLILVFLNGYWMIFIFSTLCARFRDLGLFITAIMSASTLLTPILWEKERLGRFENLVYLNPFTSMVEAVRDPLIGIPVNPIIYILLVFYLIFGFFISGLLYKYKKHLFNFWI